MTGESGEGTRKMLLIKAPFAVLLWCLTDSDMTKGKICYKGVWGQHCWPDGSRGVD